VKLPKITQDGQSTFIALIQGWAF